MTKTDYAALRGRFGARIEQARKNNFGGVGVPIDEAVALLRRADLAEEMAGALEDLSVAFATVMREEHVRGAQGDNLFLALPMSVTGTWGPPQTRARAALAKYREERG